MGRAVFMWLLTAPMQAAAQQEFTAPQPYTVDRYQSGWRKNPFVLKTAPIVREQVSFARDWIIAGCFGAEDNPSVIIMNTKTRERMRLKRGEPAGNGMVLNFVKFQASRKDTVAEIALGSATAVLKFDESYLKHAKPQMGAGRPSSSSSKVTGAEQASNHDPVASMPRDQGSGFPYTYGNGGDGGSVASVEDANPTEGRRRLLTAQKPVGSTR